MSILDRFRKSDSEYGIPANATNEQISGWAKRCLNTPEGDLLLRHLVIVFGLDEQVGYISGEESSYINGKQDGLKYILSLIIE